MTDNNERGLDKQMPSTPIGSNRDIYLGQYIIDSATTDTGEGDESTYEKIEVEDVDGRVFGVSAVATQHEINIAENISDLNSTETETEKSVAMQEAESLEAESNLESRRLDISTNIERIGSKVHEKLRRSLVFNSIDITLGIGRTVGNKIAELAKAQDTSKMNYPQMLLLIHDESNQENTVTEDVANMGTGTSSGKDFLEWSISEESQMPDNLKEYVVDRLVERGKSMKNFRKQSAFVSGLKAIDDQEAWSVLEDAYTQQALEQVIAAHEMFFESFRPETQSIDMEKDFLNANALLEFTKGVDFETVSRGSGQAGIIMTPLSQDINLPNDRLDAMDKIERYAGGNIASIGSNSFVALVSRNDEIDKINTGDEFNGAFLYLGYRPGIPAYAFDELDALNYEDDGGVLPMHSDLDHESVKSLAQIRWQAKAWHVKDKAYSILQKEMGQLKDDPANLVATYINPRDTISAGYQKILEVFRSRETQVSEKQAIRAKIMKTLDEDIANTSKGIVSPPLIVERIFELLDNHEKGINPAHIVVDDSVKLV